MIGDNFQEDWEFEEITLQRRASKSLGFCITGGIDNSPIDKIVVSKILPNGVAREDGRLRPSDVILSVNGVHMDNIKHEEAVEAIGKCENYVTLHVKRKKKIIRKVTVQRNNRIGLGIKILGELHRNGILMICDILKGGPSDFVSGPQIGDIILAVNDEDVSFTTEDHAADVIEKAGNEVTLTLVQKASLLSGGQDIKVSNAPDPRHPDVKATLIEF